MKNSAGISLLLSRLMVSASLSAVASQSADASFSWMDGEAAELDGETLSELMAGVVANADSIEWETTPGGLRRTSFDDFDAESVHIYLPDSSFVVAAVVDKAASASQLDDNMDAISEELRSFL